MWPAYQEAHAHLIKTTRKMDNQYPLIYLEAPDPTAKDKTTELKIYDWKNEEKYKTFTETLEVDGKKTLF